MRIHLLVVVAVLSFAGCGVEEAEKNPGDLEMIQKTNQELGGCYYDYNSGRVVCDRYEYGSVKNALTDLCLDSATSPPSMQPCQADADYNPRSTQHWKHDSQNGLLKNVRTGLCLEGRGQWTSPATLMPCNGGDVYQQLLWYNPNVYPYWRKRLHPGYLRNVGTGLCLTVHHLNTTPGVGSAVYGETCSNASTNKYDKWR